MNLDIHAQTEQLVAEYKVKIYKHRVMNSMLKIVMIDRQRHEMLVKPMQTLPEAELVGHKLSA